MTNEAGVEIALERTFFPMGKRIYCSCHPTWLPCKTSIIMQIKLSVVDVFE